MVGARLQALTLVLSLAVPLVAAAGDLQFSASVDQTTVGLGEQFQLNLTVQGENMLSAPSPSLPAMADFNVLGSSSSQSTNISIINGQLKREASITFIYALSAKRLGSLTIPAAKLSYQGKEYESQPIEINVVRAAQGQAAPAPQQQPSGPSGGGQVPIEGNLVLSVLPSRRTVYVGEPITLEVAVATRLRVTGGGWAQMPTFDGFWAENVYDANQFDFQRKTVDGRAYDVSVLKKVVLFPLSPGETAIKPMAFNVAVLQAPRDFFGFFGSTENVRIESKPITLRVLPLPDKDKPKEFTGGVGRFTMSASLDRATSNNSEAINLTVRITGTGNIRLIEKPEIPSVTGLRILDPEIKDDDHVAGGGMSGTKTLRYPIIPQTDGKFVIAPIKMAYFDPQAKSYKRLEAGPFELTSSGSAPNAPLVEATGLKVLGTDINYIKPDASALPVTPFDLPQWPNALYLVSVGTLAGAFWYRGHSERLVSDRGYARKVRSSGLVKRRLKVAERFLNKHDEKAFYASLAQAVTGYVGDRFNIDTHALTKDQLRAELLRLQVRPEASSALMDVLEQCEIARFSPGMLANKDPRPLFQKAREALGQV